ncbi:C58 family peptidase [Rahnella perminowiae]|uniref:C58 family peptidase n=1 Tax=Rahnella perminowiae TaxID=2816244 RepID=UPI00215C100B|nr:C58 family peptidase [Rahnella perminowiae]MCR9000122.1 C58 family peptidase [Rahnella perminowiae]
MRFKKVMQLATATHCSDYSLFHQINYLDLSNARHQVPFLRQGYWQKNSMPPSKKTIQHGPGGACLGLVLTYAQKRGNYHAWKNYVLGAEGASVVRGMTNIALLFSEMKTYNDFHLREMCRPLGLDLFDVLKKKNPRSETTEAGTSSLTDVAAREIVYSCMPGRVEYLSIRMSNAGHAMGLFISRDRYKVFDPNLGEFIFKKESDLITFLQGVFTTFYPDIKRWSLYHMVNTTH